VLCGERTRIEPPPRFPQSIKSPRKARLSPDAASLPNVVPFRLPSLYSHVVSSDPRRAAHRASDLRGFLHRQHDDRRRRRRRRFLLTYVPIVASSSMIAAGLSGPMFVDFLYVAVAMVWISVDYHRRLCLKELPDKLLRRRKEWREIGLLYMCAIVTTLQRCKADWNSASPKSESPKAGTASEFNTGKSNGRRNELIDIESHPCNADFAGAEHGIKEGKAKTSAGWVAATAAPHHATGNRGLLSGFIIEHDDQFVHAVDGIPRKVLARGAVITDSVVLPDVWFVPGLTENLVSISQLVELDHSVGFSCGECCVRSTDGKVVGKGHLQDGGLYVLDFLKVPLAI